MRYFDIHLHSAFSGGQSSVEQIASTAKFLGYSSICFSAYYKGDSQIKELRKEADVAEKKTGVKVYLGFEARDEKDLEKLKTKRKMYDILLVHGGDIEMNRLAVETPEVDILTHPESNRNDCGMNDVMIRLARKNSVAIEVNMREVLIQSRSSRSKTIQNIAKNVMMAQKIGAKIVTCSGAVSHYEMKDPKSMAAFSEIVGLTKEAAIASISTVPGEIAKISLERQGNKWVIPGVKILRGRSA